MPKLLSLGLVFVFVCVLALAPAIQAGPITVVVPNGNFATPAVSVPPGYASNQIPDSWNYNGTASKGMQVNQFYFGSDINESGTLKQLDLGTNVHAIGDIYTLTFVSAGYNVGTSTLTANLLVDGIMVAYKNVTGPSATQGYSLEWTANATGALGISFDFAGTGLAQVVMQEVGLSYAPVPEPSAMALLATGLLGLLWRAPGGKRR
jgi:hypothetical protein